MMKNASRWLPVGLTLVLVFLAPQFAAAQCVITCPANITQANDPNQCGAVVNYPAPTTQGACGVITCSPASGSFFPVATTTITCTTTAGPTCSFTITVVDTQPPSITCPANITQTAAGPTPVVYPPPTASDNCPGVSAACAPPSGSTFPIGATTTTCTATDGSGNTATCSFLITLNAIVPALPAWGMTSLALAVTTAGFLALRARRRRSHGPA